MDWVINRLCTTKISSRYTLGQTTDMEGEWHNEAESLIQFRISWHDDEFKKITKVKISLISFFCPKLNTVHLC